MILLKKSVKAWGTENLPLVFKNELTSFDHHLLPLQKGLCYSSYVSNNAISPVIIDLSESPHSLTIKASIFYTGIIAGCSCADDPTPQDLQNECCELVFIIDRETGETEIKMV